MNETPLHPWLIAEKEGNVLAAHCNCMADLGETCSHIGALLFAIEASVKLTKSQIVTQEKSLTVALCSAESRREAGKKKLISHRHNWRRNSLTPQSMTVLQVHHFIINLKNLCRTCHLQVKWNYQTSSATKTGCHDIAEQFLKVMWSPTQSII